MTSCLATAVKQYFELKGDSKTDRINIAIPANIRFAHYGSWEKVKFENKFAPCPLVIPLDNDIKKSLQKIPKATAFLKKSFVDVYVTYAMTYYWGMFMPYYVLDYTTAMASLPYTLAFSNTPGLLKPIILDGDKKTKKVHNYVIPGGHTGIALACISYVDYLQITCTADEAIMDDSQTLLDLVEKNLKQCYPEEDEKTTLGGPLSSPERN